MKKVIAVLVLLAAFAVMLVRVNAYDDIVRIHILAASDSEEDQRIKLLVRDEVNEYLAPVLSKCKTKAQAEKALTERLDDIRVIAENTAGCDVTVTLAEEDFPERTYNNKVYPAGKYTALKVMIGEAQGRNWWCVAFPPMCYVSNNSNRTEYRSLIIDFLERIGIL